jgi:hypothetical protein
MSCPAKSSPLEPLSTSLLKEFVDVLAIPITTIINLSLSSGVFPKGMKIAFITPLLKKPSLCPEDLSNYWPVSNLSFLSKLVERSTEKQFTAHLNFPSTLRCNLLIVDIILQKQHAFELSTTCEWPLMLVMLRYFRC